MSGSAILHPLVENGFLYGRGASDTVRGLARAPSPTASASLASVPRSLVIAYSSDEETTMKTSKIIAERLTNAHIVLILDGASGTLSEATGEPLYWSWQGAGEDLHRFPSRGQLPRRAQLDAAPR